jgi:hypothetical protein
MECICSKVLQQYVAATTKSWIKIRAVMEALGKHALVSHQEPGLVSHPDALARGHAREATCVQHTDAIDAHRKVKKNTLRMWDGYLQEEEDVDLAMVQGTSAGERIQHLF